MLSRNLLNITVSPRDDFEEFFKQFQKIIDDADTLRHRSYIATVAAKAVEEEMQPEKMAQIMEMQEKIRKSYNYYFDKLTLELKGYGVIGELFDLEEKLKDLKPQSNIKWIGNKTELLELIYALKNAGLVQASSYEEAKSAFSQFFGADLTNSDVQLNQMISRKSDLKNDKTPFFEKLSKAWRNYVEERLNKNNK